MVKDKPTNAKRSLAIIISTELSALWDYEMSFVIISTEMPALWAKEMLLFNNFSDIPTLQA